MMEILDARWTPKINILKVKCVYGHLFEHPSNRHYIECPTCRQQEHLHRMRCWSVGDYDEIRIREEIKILSKLPSSKTA